MRCADPVAECRDEGINSQILAFELLKELDAITTLAAMRHAGTDLTAAEVEGLDGLVAMWDLASSCVGPELLRRALATWLPEPVLATCRAVFAA